jgi:hypothetical protein
MRLFVCVYDFCILRGSRLKERINVVRAVITWFRVSPYRTIGRAWRTLCFAWNGGEVAVRTGYDKQKNEETWCV